MSDPDGIVEYVFEHCDDAGLVATIEEATRSEAAAAALRLAAIGELATRCEDPEDPRELWACDVADSAAAQVASACNISHGKACGQIRSAQTLRDKLPRTAALFARGALSARVVASITWRTRLIVDDSVWAQLDAAVCERAEQWGPLADELLTSMVDAVVFEFDSAAVIGVAQRLRSRDFTVGAFEDEGGLVSVFGKLVATDANVLKARIAALTAMVCEKDPRTAGQRRSDAVGAIACGADRLVCTCARRDCPADRTSLPPYPAVISVIAADEAVDAARRYNENNTATVHDNGGPAASDSDDTDPVAPQAEPTVAKCAAPRTDHGTAIMADGTVIPTPLLARLLAAGARVKPLRVPRESAPEPRYRPSAMLAAFIRARDVTCRFRGCRVPASRCDIDHVLPWPIGPTHPSNLICLCRKHHNLKTFWDGDWSVTLASDGAATWTAPTGHTYTTHPGSRALFPDWHIATGDLPPQRTGVTAIQRRGQIPLRTQSRAAQRAQRIEAERKQNTSDPPF